MGDIIINGYGQKSDLTVINHKLDIILKILQRMYQMEVHMTQELDSLEVAVAENESLDDSIVVLLNGIAAQLAAIKDDPKRIAALAASLVAKSQVLKDAILANTPVEPTPEPSSTPAEPV